MSDIRLPVIIGTIHEIVIIVGGERADRQKYHVRAQSSRFREGYTIGIWDTFEEAAEEFKKWDEIRKAQRGDAY